MTATDELRKLLDERGITHKTDTFVIDADHGKVKETAWVIGNSHHVYQEYRDRTVLTSTSIAPEQAIAATLGNGTCKMEQIPECRYDDIECSECGVALWAFSMDKAGEGVIATPNYCPYCGRAVEQ